MLLHDALMVEQRAIEQKKSILKHIQIVCLSKIFIGLKNRRNDREYWKNLFEEAIEWNILKWAGIVLNSFYRFVGDVQVLRWELCFCFKLQNWNEKKLVPWENESLLCKVNRILRIEPEVIKVKLYHFSFNFHCNDTSSAVSVTHVKRVTCSWYYARF